MSAPLRRQQAAQAAVDRFKGQPLAYGKNDCVRLAAFVLRKMGHRPQLARAGTYSNALGAARALQRAGFEDLAAAVDALGLPRIAPAAAWVADLVLLPADGPFGGALSVAVGNGRVLGYHEDVEGADILQPVKYLAAWRV
ncbi:DUF6950 family protein [Sphingomonas desiccabilis]|uniref:DUF6950 domain-containing protein n=1 Tax=Sphingomonas desiccabilis TaxID=429134 RepID=A0A4V1QPY7_9SPHN|nr:hypothetical protein [Sphingomonas desiccabilis]MBB3910831.1 hypothetical protein [Sphingomonas desiccabilis]RXZ35437.1 hypothetical protein EO081_07420 [Sphingomonas desiccabilis]